VPPEPKRQKENIPKVYGAVDETWVEFHMPSGAIVILTHELIQQCRTDANAFTNATLRALGVRPPLIKGWVAQLHGKPVTAEKYREALRGRYIYNSGKLN
jgi:hypothetical protein